MSRVHGLTDEPFSPLAKMEMTITSDDVDLGVNDILGVVFDYSTVPGSGRRITGVLIGLGSLTVRRVGIPVFFRKMPTLTCPPAA